MHVRELSESWQDRPGVTGVIGQGSRKVAEWQRRENAGRSRSVMITVGECYLRHSGSYLEYRSAIINIVLLLFSLRCLCCFADVRSSSCNFFCGRENRRTRLTISRVSPPLRPPPGRTGGARSERIFLGNSLTCKFPDKLFLFFFFIGVEARKTKVVCRNGSRGKN